MLVSTRVRIGKLRHGFTCTHTDTHAATPRYPTIADARTNTPIPSAMPRFRFNSPRPLHHVIKTGRWPRYEVRSIRRRDYHNATVRASPRKHCAPWRLYLVTSMFFLCPV